MPENLDFDNIKASLENNLLIVTIQKLQFSSKSIKIDRVEM
ncbi:Hsp20 family protein [bacterium]|jgi:HSP20 family molecular chaperone IbpA|nr:Hsp20 family protein [bacterium]MBT3852516.1 Hsp20 family protein [bacterium]MBT4632681.1 Hsp20 family protein [bacterium]MBT5491460.1 Hsp20 family protein [bacterium]MBT6778298.1 Hsp20 family protein [bacterium]